MFSPKDFVPDSLKSRVKQATLLDYDQYNNLNDERVLIHKRKTMIQ